MSTMVHHPVGKRFLLRKSSNAENMVPSFSKKADALVSAREASRRRRARVVSGSAPLKVKKVVLNAQRHHTKAQRAKLAKVSCAPAATAPVPAPTPAPAPAPVAAPAESLKAVQEAIKSTPAVAALFAQEKDSSETTIHFPRFLRRPPPQVWPVPINRENVDACDPELEDVELEFILRGLEVTGENMWHLVKNARIDSSSMGHCASLPDEVNVTIADHVKLQCASPLPHSHPTHVLALWELPVAQPVHKNSGINPETGRRKVSLVAAHNLVLAAHCGKWFPLAKSERATETRVSVNEGGAPGTQLNLPVVPLAVPHPASFMYLLQTLYTHKVSWLLDQLVPVQKPSMALPTPQNPNPQNPHYILETGRRVAARFTPQAIVQMLGTVIGLWQNAIYLGISDRRLWVGIDWSWDMLLTGLAMSIGRPELVPRPQPRVAVKA